ncbi:glycosyltransferase [Lactobacillus delbrueckii]|uniref:glycosyltransferase n=1 Tax=Lactobacillus delbrueckii TaxID=1584 RepID=UPI000682F7BA|nr:glycosyltransferase [Lactobacillus delbrueckii]APP03580.1 hypothetical protein LI610_09235 [Lactobacillus delbrueckii subsp. indicus]KNE30005.1 hypothetical protein LDI10_08325 [Lactobacillus delbrueckii subsp. indicus]KRL75845.1 glycosyltransferase [Lactobacillus delbrueckii subsp. indicus DSM 15996]
MRKAAGVVVLYNPIESEVLQNIKSYVNELDVIYCIDNSDEENNFFSEIEKCVYIPNHKNIGLSKALALGCDKAVREGATVLVTLDQDTVFEKKCISALIKYVEENNDAGVVSPNVKRIVRINGKRKVIDSALYSSSIEEVGYVITSGCVFTAETYDLTGGFDESLFIGQIDQDFCCSVRKINKKVLRLGNVFMYQEMGNGEKHNLFGRTVYAPNLALFRYYYIFRNERYLRKKWGTEYNICKVSLYKYVAVVMLFEKAKSKKLEAMFNGYKDGKKMIERISN